MNLSLFFPSIPSNSTMPPPLSHAILRLMFGMNCAEMAQLCILLGATLLNAWMVRKSAILHWNLKAILLAQSALIFPYTSLRLIELFWTFTGNWGNMFGSFPLMAAINLACITCGNLIGHLIILERTMATVYARQYEQCKSPCFTLAWISLMALLVILEQLIPSLGFSRAFGFGVFVTHLALLLSIFELIAFSVLSAHNRNIYTRYNNFKLNLPPQYRLSERYQLLENVYTGRQLAPSFIFHFLNILASNIVSIFSVYIELAPVNFALLLDAVFLTHAASKLAIEITIITYHPLLRRKLKRIIGTAKKYIALGRSSRIEGGDLNNEGEMPSSSDALTMPMRERHFEMLRHFWQ